MRQRMSRLAGVLSQGLGQPEFIAVIDRQESLCAGEQYQLRLIHARHGKCKKRGCG
jgi:hypothetical protein